MRKVKIIPVLLTVFFWICISGAALSTEIEGKIDINTASIDQLTMVKGIGPVLAQRIVDYRKAEGDFKSVDDIKQVKGIGGKTFTKIKDEITVRAVVDSQ